MSEHASDTTEQDNLDTPAAIKADLLAGMFFLVLGLVIAYLSWDMPRLETRRIHPATIPGLVPGLLGGALALCGFLLALSSARAAPLASGWKTFGHRFVGAEAKRVLALAGMVLVYSLGLIGWLPFWLATGLFVFVAIVAFEVWLNDAPAPLARSLIWAAVQAVIVAGAVTFVFERGFLVRLP
ncbi:tripartite tricarboxylate transporter TctB family protein [Pelagibacterium limicola]|uniref:tripartite tricarboxylate transporter TctB family protein n=1 Tax=Pelagibacterium limicola TaxID=2791022 RepID=UPI0018AF7EEB|nr:tripartite tricarboxylate transporter TctB family protein [Pelagibacterium limicola]